MPSRSLAVARRRWRAPSTDGAALVEPSAEELDERWLDNRACQSNQRFSINQIPIGQLRSVARQQLIAAATEYTRQYRNVPVIVASETPAPIVMAGHQPELVHPGVWFKNFVLSRIARRFNAAAINFSVDTDECTVTSIRVPTGSRQKPAIEWVPFDRLQIACPYEAAKAVDTKMFESFGDRVRDAIRPWIQTPLIEVIWPKVLTLYPLFENVGRALAAARHQYEAECGLLTLELPLSEICETESFAHFAAEIFSRTEEFNLIHNQVLGQYRSENRVRGHARPVPDLESEPLLWETPFWFWSSTHPGRQRLFATIQSEHLLLTNRSDWTARLPRRELAAAIYELLQSNVAIRPRALLTTTYARLILSDLFLHGIGGAKYDEVTDEIARRFFRIELPNYLTLSATLRLPIELPDVGIADRLAIQRRLRDIRYHPEVFYDGADSDVAELIAQKKNWIQSPDPQLSHLRHITLNSINHQLSSGLAEVQRDLMHQLESVNAELSRKSLLGSREFSYVLFPESLPGRLEGIATQALG